VGFALRGVPDYTGSGREMKVSIVTISYNQARFLEQAICSVLEQDYTDIEYIIVDPGSTDGSREIIQKYSDRFARIILDTDNGPADGLNKGFMVSTGEIFGFLNSDDMLFAGTITKIVHEFQKKTGADVISGHGFLLDEYNDRIRPIFSHCFGLMDYLYGACVLVQQATFYRHKAIKQVGGFNTFNRVNWDGELWADIAQSGGKFHRVHSFLAGFRSHPNSISNSVKYRQALKREQDRICNKFGVKRIPFVASLLWLKNRLLDPLITGARFLQSIGINNFFKKI
jgi:glycosyltransferase involved in cell wall biosynthesis